MNFNGSNKSIKNIRSGRFPQMQAPIKKWVRSLIFDKIIKIEQEFEVRESKERIEAKGVWQPYSPTDLRSLPEGQRAWSWFMVHTLTDIELIEGDRIVFEDKIYRVMKKGDYHLNSFFEYAVIFDYQYEVPNEVQ